MTRDLIEVMARARWESLAGDIAWRELSPEMQHDQREAMRAAAGAAVAFVADWIAEHGHVGAEHGTQAVVDEWREAMGDGER